jgi:hypothetical protein
VKLTTGDSQLLFLLEYGQDNQYVHHTDKLQQKDIQQLHSDLQYVSLPSAFE